MTLVGPESTAPAATAARVPDTLDWVYVLSVPGPDRDDALRRLHGLLLHAARHQVWRMSAQLPPGCEPIEDIANRAADDALFAVLRKLSTFAGRSRFTTWAYKFAVLHAAVEVRRVAWRRRDVPLTDVRDLAGPDDGPAAIAESTDLLAAVRTGMTAALTAHQRRVMVALLVDDVPVDVLADRLGTNRNALYKTLHDGRVRLRAYLVGAGYLPERATEAGAS
jgi:RNA polymerase sigma-70 factor (ECF subfamily)